MQWIRAMTYLRSLRDGEEGQGMVEYALILALISVVALTVLTNIGNGVVQKLGEVATKL